MTDEHVDINVLNTFISYKYNDFVVGGMIIQLTTMFVFVHTLVRFTRNPGVSNQFDKQRCRIDLLM